MKRTHLNKIRSSRKLERESERNVEIMWLTGKLLPCFKTIAAFRSQNGDAIRQVCREFILLCREMDLFGGELVAIDGSKFKAVNSRERSFTQNKLKRLLKRLDEKIQRYLEAMDDNDEDDTCECPAGARPTFRCWPTTWSERSISCLLQLLDSIEDIHTRDGLAASPSTDEITGDLALQTPIGTTLSPIQI